MSTPPYTSPLRQRQTAETRAVILQALGAELAAVGLEGISVARLARRARVSERTVFRHFPTRETLLDGLSQWFNDRVGDFPHEVSAEAIPTTIAQVFADFDEHEALARAVLESPGGREFRRHARAARLDRLQAALAPVLDVADADRAAAPRAPPPTPRPPRGPWSSRFPARAPGRRCATRAASTVRPPGAPSRTPSSSSSTTPRPPRRSHEHHDPHLVPRPRPRGRRRGAARPGRPRSRKGHRAADRRRVLDVRDRRAAWRRPAAAPPRAVRGVPRPRRHAHHPRRRRQRDAGRAGRHRRRRGRRAAQLPQPRPRRRALPRYPG